MAFNVLAYAAAVKIAEETIEGAGLIKGDKGDKGDPGPKGDKGDKGDTGEPGTWFSQNFDYKTVEELLELEEGEPGILYMIPSEGDENNSYDEWMWNVKDEKFEKVGSMSGSAATTENVTANKAVGAIAAGTTIPKGTELTEFLQQLLIDEIAPAINFTISKSGNVVHGSSYTEKLTCTITSLGTATPLSIDFYEGSTLVESSEYVSGTTSYSYTMDHATTSNTTFKAVLNYKKSDGNNASINKTSSISFYYNKFYGGVSDLTPSEATVEALTTTLGTAKGGTYSFTVTAGRIAYAYPKSLGVLTSIKDGNGFSLFDSFTRSEVTYTQNSTSVDYYLYVLTDATTVSGYSVTFA